MEALWEPPAGKAGIMGCYYFRAEVKRLADLRGQVQRLGLSLASGSGV